VDRGEAQSEHLSFVDGVYDYSLILSRDPVQYQHFT
jgi:hypothetical protein